MSQTIDATYDGEFLRPDHVLSIAPNTRVRVTVEVLPDEEATAREKPASFLNVARSLKLDGPSDWARNIDKYLYGDPNQPRG